MFFLYVIEHICCWHRQNIWRITPRDPNNNGANFVSCGIHGRSELVLNVITVNPHKPILEYYDPLSRILC